MTNSASYIPSKPQTSEKTFIDECEHNTPLTTKFFNFLQAKAGEDLKNFEGSKVKRMLSVASRIGIQILKVLSTPIRFVEITIQRSIDSVISLKESLTDKSLAKKIAIVSAAILLSPVIFSLHLVKATIMTSLLTVGSVFMIPLGICTDMNENKFQVF